MSLLKNAAKTAAKKGAKAAMNTVSKLIHGSMYGMMSGAVSAIMFMNYGISPYFALGVAGVIVLALYYNDFL